MAEDEIATLKEALSNQLLFIKRLQAELDDEREASASGADEALTMILRLQKEKAEEKMEACQYKQMAESKMSHAEEYLAMLEQVICQKDIEIASLKHQVQSYMQMLVRAGVNNAEIMKLSESRWSRTSSFLERTSSCVQVRRQTSMPSIRFKQLRTEVAIKDGDGSLTPTIQWRGFGDNKNQLLEHQTQCTSEISSVKESESVLANNQFNSAEEESSPCSWYSAGSTEMISSSSCPCLETESTGDIQYVSTQRMFEIPKANNGFILRKSSKTHREVEQMMTIPESMPGEAPTNSLEDDDFSNKDELSTLKKGASLDFQPNFAFQNDVGQIKCQVQQLVDDVRIMKEEDLKQGKEQLKLLRKIYEQIKPVQSPIKNSKSKKSSPEDEILIASLTEAMLSFSL